MKKDKIISMIFLGILFLIPLVISEDSNILSGDMGFSLSVQGGVICMKEGVGNAQWKDYSVSPPVTRDALGPNGNCYSEEGINEQTGDPDTTCCPDNSVCEEFDTSDSSNPIYKCMVSEKQICSQFNENTESCTENGNGNIDVAISTVEGLGEFCGRDPFTWPEGTTRCQNVTHCTCVWDSATSKCNALQNLTTECYEVDDPDPVIEDIGRCEWTLVSSEDHCNDGGGYIKFVWDGEWTGTDGGDSACTTGVEQQVDCSNVIMMGFFDENMFIVSIFLILIIYSLQLIVNKKSIWLKPVVFFKPQKRNGCFKRIGIRTFLEQ